MLILWFHFMRNPIDIAEDFGVYPWNAPPARLRPKADDPIQVPLGSCLSHQGSPRVSFTRVLVPKPTGADLLVFNGDVDLGDDVGGLTAGQGDYWQGDKSLSVAITPCFCLTPSRGHQFQILHIGDVTLWKADWSNECRKDDF